MGSQFSRLTAALLGAAAGISLLTASNSSPARAQAQAQAQAGSKAADLALIAEYGELPTVEEASLSASGKRVAVIARVDGQRSLIVLDDDQGQLARVAVGDAKIRDLDWAGDDRILLTMSQTESLGFGFIADKEEFYTMQVVPLDPKAKGGFVFANRREIVNAINGFYGVREIDGRHYGFFGGMKLRAKRNSEYEFDHGRPYLFKVDLEDFSVRQIAQAAPPGHYHRWLIDERGEVAATLDVHSESGKWSLRSGLGRPIASGTNPLARIGLLGLGYNGASVLLSEETDSGVEWFEVPLAGGEPQPFLDDIAVDAVYFDDRTGHLTGYLEGGENARPVMRDPAHASAVTKVRKSFPQDDMRLIDWTSDFGKAIVRTSGNGDSGTWYSVDLARMAAEIIAYERPRIQGDKVGAISVVEYTASDGLEMDGILTLPPGREARNLPAVVLPHGGPNAHDKKEFDWWAQAYAARGYAVFQPNFRGSTNRSTEFRRASAGEWGRKMQTDKSDGLKVLVDRGIVDPARVCIVGASYGGYAALAGVTLQKGIYRCAVAVAPVSDVGDLYRERLSESGRSSMARANLEEWIGPRGDLKEISPLRSAAEASAPIMLIHGQDDIVVRYSHSAKMAKALKDAGKPYELITLKGEDHWLSRSETRRTMLEAAVRFVEQHNPVS
ncbi:MAG: alpha/beta hydrolase family protein [Erythrobacter sp.]